MEKYGLSTVETGYNTRYSADVEPSISNDFTAGAFRITHSSIQGYLQYTDASLFFYFFSFLCLSCSSSLFRIGAHMCVVGNVHVFFIIQRLLKPNDDEDPDRSFSLSNYFFDASRLLQDPGFLDSALRGLTKQVPQLIDPFYSTEVTANLYKYDWQLFLLLLRRESLRPSF